MLQFLIDRLHALHVLGSSQAFLPKTGVLEVHLVDRIDTDGVLDTQFPNKSGCLRQSLLFGGTLRALNRLLRHDPATTEGCKKKDR